MINNTNIKNQDIEKITEFTINPLHQEFYNLPKYRKFIPYLNIFNEIEHYSKWICFESDLKKQYKFIK